MKALESLTLKELRDVARDAGVKGWWNMKKAELLDEISKAEIKVIVAGAPEEEKVEPEVNTLVEPEKVEENDSGAKKKNQKRLIEYNGKTQTLTAWAKELGIRHQTLYNRIVMKGWDVAKAFEKPTKKEVLVDVEESAAE